MKMIGPVGMGRDAIGGGKKNDKNM